MPLEPLCGNCVHWKPWKCVDDIVYGKCTKNDYVAVSPEHGHCHLYTLGDPYDEPPEEFWG